MQEKRLLSVKNLSVRYKADRGDVQAVTDVSFDIGQGEFFGLAGESGCGKSTIAFSIMRLLKGAANVAEGAIDFKGSHVLAFGKEELRRFRWEKSSMVLQSSMNSLNPVATVGSQLMDAIMVHEKASAKEAADRARALLSLVNIEEDRIKAYPHELSGGMRQRVVIAMALSLKPDLVIFDEPTTALDVVVQYNLIRKIKELKEIMGFSVLFITHDLPFMLQMCDRIAIMYAGRMVEIAPVKELLAGPAHPYADGLLKAFPSLIGPRERLKGIGGSVPDLITPPKGCLFYDRCFAREKDCIISPPLLEEIGKGHLCACRHRLQRGLSPKAFPPSKSGALPRVEEKAKAVVRFEHVKKIFPGQGGLLHKKHLTAVNDVSFEIKKGEILAVVGESGCGKSTLAKLLCKIHDANEGHIYVHAKDIARPMRKKEADQFRKEVQMIFQDPFASLNPAHKTGYIVGRAVEIYHPKLSKAEARERVSQLFETVGLTPAADFMEKHPSQLSGGQRQRIVIARALAVNPSIIVADEPTSMLDVSIGIEIMNLMLELQEKKQLTYLYITHNLASARYMANRMIVMYAGNCVEQGGIDDVIERPLHPYTILLLSSTPEPFKKEEQIIHAKEDQPDLAANEKQCPFAARCPKALARCHVQLPDSYKVGQREVRCFLYENEETRTEGKLTAAIYA